MKNNISHKKGGDVSIISIQNTTYKKIVSSDEGCIFKSEKISFQKYAEIKFCI